MMCKKPYIKDPTGVGLFSKNRDIRLQSTPFGCGQCLPCRINNMRVWRNRILLEMCMWPENAFVTLTYNDENIPANKNLKPKHLQLYLKRLRKSYEPERFRYFAVGEYGDRSNRPHYHVAFFNIGVRSSSSIRDNWGKGFVQCGDLNEKSARYIVGYVTKKMTRKDDYRLNGREPEFMRSSRQNGGIGYGAIVVMAKKLKKEGFNDRIVDKIMRGKNKYALGRYLTAKMNELLEIDDVLKEKRLIEYQNEIIDKHYKLGEHFYSNIVNEFKQERKIQEKKNKIFTPNKTL